MALVAPLPDTTLTQEAEVKATLTFLTPSKLEEVPA
jgi:hypothetical protein